MLVKLVCKKCEDAFGVEHEYAKTSGPMATVRIAFQCPYCAENYPQGSQIDLAGITGGVTFSGAGNLHIGGDVVGGDLIKTEG